MIQCILLENELKVTLIPMHAIKWYSGYFTKRIEKHKQNIKHDKFCH